MWDGALDGFTQTMAYSVQQYQNKPVLAIWQGQFNAGGYGFGYNLLLNQSYQVVGNVTTDLAGLGADIHEFQITSNDTALLSAYNATERDLTPYGGPEDGYILDGIFQEVDIATGKGLFVWNALEHVNPSDCYVSPGSTGTEDSPWDYFHINSIEKSQGNYLVSSRHCHAVYYIDGTNGDILWTLGGKNSTFTGAGSEFYFQVSHLEALVVSRADLLFLSTTPGSTPPTIRRSQSLTTAPHHGRHPRPPREVYWSISTMPTLRQLWRPKLSLTTT